MKHQPDHPLLFLGAKVEKIHPVMDPVLKRILLSPGQPLIITIMSEQSEVQLRRRWKESLGNSLLQRVLVLRQQPWDIFAAIVESCRAALDTWPVGGGVNSLDALGLGVPVVTMPSKINTLRFTQAWYHHMLLSRTRASDLGHEEARALYEQLVVPDENAYIAAVQQFISPGEESFRHAFNVVGRKIKAAGKHLFEQERAVTEWSQILSAMAKT